MSIAATPTNWDDPGSPPVTARRFSVSEYHRMIEAGLFAGDERIELLEGWILSELKRSPLHDTAVELTRKALRGRLSVAWHIRIKSAITMADSESAPDLAILRGVPRDYCDHHPGPREIGLIIEVTDSTLTQDRGLKARIYARASIPIYWIITLVDHRVEVYTDPTGPAPAPGYRRRQDFAAEQSVPLILDGQEVGLIAVRELLP
jgi:Putative restriction endonuclease